ncbi:MAG: right-handed parallel beta-helix repeat-containing protein [Desulfobacteraceae bacterium]|nr:right-handed parallel beta-helix repeat-containing protein [Desulfobacteraceae bacterium]
MKMKQKMILCILIGFCLFAFPSHAAVYHIDPSAKINGTGTANSPYQQWSDLPKMQKGDDVFFKCNTSYKPDGYIDISWGGTSNNPVIIGAYYMAGKSPVYGVSGKRPLISGSNYTVPSNSCFGSYDSWAGLITVRSKDFIHIKNLHLYQSGYMGISIKGDLNSGTNAAHFLIQNVRIQGSYWNGILINTNPKNYGVIEDSEVEGASYAWVERCTKGFTGALTIANSSFANTTIRRNYVHNNWGEGIGSNRIPCSVETDNSGHATIEDNIVWNNRRVDIYSDRTEHNIIRRNLLFGLNDSRFASLEKDDRAWNQYGIWINVEHVDSRGSCPDVSHDNQVYNNVVAGHYVGIGVASDYTSGVMKNNVFYNNTLIANKINLSVGSKLAGYATNNIEFRNNVSYCPDDSICNDVSGDPAWFDKKIIADYNAWTDIPKNWGGPNDLLTNNNWGKTRGWQALKTIPTIEEFMPTIGNPVIDGGDALPNAFNSAISINQSKYQIAPLDISVSTISQNANRSDPWDMGAVPYQSQLNAPRLRVVNN